MNALHETFARASEWLWAALADHLWQATLFAALVAALTLLLRRGPARVRYALWLVASAKFVVPSALFAYLAAGAGVEASWLFGHAADTTTKTAVPVIFQLAGPVSALGEAREAVPGVAHAGEFYCALSLIWLAGCAALVLVWWRRRREFLRAAAEGHEAYTGREFEAMERARRRLGLEKDVTLLLSPRGVEPGVWRTRRPVILLPESIAEHLDAEELETLMLHELVHVERRDNALGNMQMALSCLFWFHPLVWFLSRRLMAEREQACDERVLEVGGERGSYASSILKVVRFCFGWKVAGVSGAAAGSNLRRRIEKIMHEQKNPKAARWQRALPLGAATLALAFTAGAGLLSHLRGDTARAQEGTRMKRRMPSAEGQGGRMRVRSSARTQSGDGPAATEEILNAPESVVYFEYAADAPLIINDAKLKMITRDQLRRADEEGAASFDEEAKSDFLVTLPTVTVTNVSGKTIREVGIGFAKEGQVHIIMGYYAAALKPGEAQTFRSEWNRRNILMPGTFSDVSVKVVWATFTDGSAWGMLPRTPHPPPAPPLAPGVSSPRMPPPRSQGSGTSGDTQNIVGLIEMGEGRGVGQGTGEGRGSGSGGGSGAGASEARGGGAVNGGDLGGKVISAPPPAYPAIARSVRAQGNVTVRVTVDEDGHVVSAEAVSGHPLLRSAAEDAARAARFSPTMLSGKPVKVNGKVSYNFVLADSEDDPE